MLTAISTASSAPPSARIRKHKDSTPTGPLVIPALPNRDWREAAEQARASRQLPPGPYKKKQREIYIPDAVGGMRVGAGPNAGRGSRTVQVEKDVINDDPVVGGLAVRSPAAAGRPGSGSGSGTAPAANSESVPMSESNGNADANANANGPGLDSLHSQNGHQAAVNGSAESVSTSAMVETDEQKALRELLSGQDGGAGANRVELDVIESAADARGIEGAQQGDLFKRDVDSRPDEVRLTRWLAGTGTGF